MTVRNALTIGLAALLGGVIGASLVLAEVKAQATTDPDHLRVKSLEIVDDRGVRVCSIETTHGAPALKFYNPNELGNPRLKMQLGLSEPSFNSSPYIYLHGSEPSPGIKLTVGGSRDADDCSLFVGDKSTGVEITTTKAGSSLIMRDESCTPRATLSFSEGGKYSKSSLKLAGTGENCAGLSVEDDIPNLNLVFNKAELRAHVTEEHGSNLSFRDSARQEKMRLGLDAGQQPEIWRAGPFFGAKEKVTSPSKSAHGQQRKRE